MWKVMKIFILVLVAIFATILLVRGFDSRRMPDLKPWHKAKLPEFRAGSGAPGTLAEYLELEDRLFQSLETQVYDRVEAADQLPFNRFHQGSLSDPGRQPHNWNRTFELEPEQRRGAALLLHGLTDSPYSVRAVGEALRDQGFYVLGLRVPGHGTIPASLTTVRWADWLAAAELGYKHVRGIAGEGEPVFVGGYSTGGALALRMVLDAVEEGRDDLPDRLFLFSPAIGVTKAAAFANWHKVLSWIPFFEKLKWASIDAEFDPFKYNSFPKNAGDQVYLLTKSSKRKIGALADQGLLGKLPPMLAFQSLVDTTIVVKDLIELYGRLEPGSGSELVLFDTNRRERFRDLIKDRGTPLLQPLVESRELPYALTVVTNRGDRSAQAVARRKPPQSDFRPDEPLGARWPRQVYSLSHVAVPFPPYDPIYGAESEAALPLGRLHPRGEKSLLTVPISSLMRLRFNPFFDYMRERITGAIS